MSEITELKPKRGRPKGSTGKGYAISIEERNRRICEMSVYQALSNAEIARRMNLDKSLVGRIIQEHLSNVFPDSERREMALVQFARYNKLLERWMPVALLDEAEVMVNVKDVGLVKMPASFEDATKAAKVVLDVMSRVDKRFGLEEFALEGNDDDLDADALKQELQSLLNYAKPPKE